VVSIDLNPHLERMSASDMFLNQVILDIFRVMHET